MKNIKLINGYPFVKYSRDTYSPNEMLEKAATFEEWMQKRRTCRDFCDKPIPKEVIENILLAASTAPSGAHKQPWTFCVVTNPELKSKIKIAAEEEEYESYDRSKRPLMGMAAAELSDFVVLTSDNPRSEDPLAIINDALVGLRRFDTNHIVEPDRAKAIEAILNEARPDDVVILAGKGHETYQVLKDKTIDFDDREVAKKSLSKAGYGAAS